MIEHQHDDLLEEESFDMAATRPALLFGLPHSLSCSILALGLLVVMFYDTNNQVNDLIVDAVIVGALGMLWSTARIMLRSDYHGWDNFLAYLRLDFRCLDTKEWGGARVASMPLRSIYRCGASDA